MIQRKQSLYLFLAALVNSGVLVFDQYRYVIQSTVNGVTVNTPMQIRVTNHYPSLLIALVMIVLPLVTIFMYGNRKRQVTMSTISLLAVTSFVTLSLKRITNTDALVPPPVSSTYWIGSILPAVSLVLLVLAVMGIRRDEKLVKSVDRLR